MVLETHYSGLLSSDHFRGGSSTRMGILTCQVGTLPSPRHSYQSLCPKHKRTLIYEAFIAILLLTALTKPTL